MHDLDLFGQVVVTWPEVVDWVARVAGITPDSPRWLPYVRTWRVPEKVAAAKLAGRWPPEKNPRAGRCARPGEPRRHLVVKERRAARAPIGAPAW